MLEMPQFERLYPDDRLTSPSGRFVLSRDAAGVPVITDTGSDQVVWRAGAAGTLLLGNGYEVLVETEDDHEPDWRSGFAAPGAQYLILTDAGELELLDRSHVRLGNIRTGPVHAVALGDAAPAAAITADAYLVREGRTRRTVAREQNGWLRVSRSSKGGGGSYALTGRLVDWLDHQEGAQLTWRLHRPGGSTAEVRLLSLVDSEGAVLWHEGTLLPHGPILMGTPYAYGGPTLETGGRLRNQSLTSPDGTHTLVHRGNGDLALHCHTEHRVVWRTGTDGIGDGWAELSENGDLSVRNVLGAQIWSSGTAGSGARRLVVRDDGRAELLDADGRSVWSTGPHDACEAPAADAPRGAVLRRGQTLGPHSLTSTCGRTVLGHWDERHLVLFAADHTWLWNTRLGETDEPGLRLDEDGMLRVLGDERPPLGGPAEELCVQEGEVVLRRADGGVVWRNGEVIEPGAVPEETAEDFGTWMTELTDRVTYCATVVHDITPDEALVRLGADPAGIRTGDWSDLLTRSEIDDTGVEDVRVAAFALGPHTLLVEDNGWLGIHSPALSAGTLAVSAYSSVNGDTDFVVHRNGETVVDRHGDISEEPVPPEIEAAMAAMGADDPLEAASEDILELLCRTADVRPTVADVTGAARFTIIPAS
ncbi:DUF6461 domain-containing protein [Streptomyces sp. NPDC006296]|uniref:DUF6461 domain-containing protein n=1 Tax=Streptomyces sp. NPDC006296 TaxID=3156746 RepID=UPI0033A5A444